MIAQWRDSVHPCGLRETRFFLVNSVVNSAQMEVEQSKNPYAGQSDDNGSVGIVGVFQRELVVRV